MPKQFYFEQFSLALILSLNVKTALFQAIQFCINVHFSSVWLIDRNLLGATTHGQSGLVSDGNEGVFFISQSSSITEDSFEISIK